MGYYTMHGTLQTRATELAPQARGTAISLFAFFFFMGQATGPQLLGSILKPARLCGRLHRCRRRPLRDRADLDGALRASQGEATPELLAPSVL